MNRSILTDAIKQIKIIDRVKRSRDEESMVISETKTIRKLTVKDAMIKAAVVYSDDDVDKIIKKLKREDTNVCIVVTKDKRFVGEISNEDMIRLFLHQVKSEELTKRLNIGYKREFFYKCAEELINKHNATIRLDTPINKAIELVYEEGFEYIPVVDKNERVLGVVTPSSILDLLQNH